MLLQREPSVSLSESGFGETVRSPLEIWLAMAAVLRRFAVMTLIVSTTSLISSLVLISTFWLRSPMATAEATAAIFRRPLLIPSAIQPAAMSATSVAMTAIEIISILVVP
jgi:hypothetical protein